MTGTSPFSYQSPSYHSSSYLPKLEANFFRDFSCCGQTLPSLHDLLQHYEEVHAQQLQSGQLTLPQTGSRDARPGNMPTNGNNGPGGLSILRQQQAHQQKLAQLANQNQGGNRTDRLGSMGMGMSGVDVAEEMEMDDGEITPPTSNIQMMSALSTGLSQHQDQQSQQSQLQAALRLSTQLPNSTMQLSNPTVSSVNTPNMPNPMSPNTERYMSPESSVPGTPRGDGNTSFDNLNFQNMNLGNNMYLPMDNSDMNLDLCIADPGKALYNPMGANGPRGFQQLSLAQLRAAREQSELARMMAVDGLSHPAMGAGVNIPGDGNSQANWGCSRG